MGNISHTVSSTSNVAAFQSAARVPVTGTKFYFKPKQEGTGIPSPDNVREIHGWTGIEGYQSNDNLFDVDNIKYSSWTASNGVEADVAYGCVTNYKIPISANTKISLFIFGNVYSKSIIFYNLDGTFNTRAHSSGNTTINYTPSIDCYAKIQIANSVDQSLPITKEYLQQAKIVCVIGNINVESYIEHCGQTIPIEFPVLGKNKFNPDFDWTIGETYRYICLSELENECNLSFVRKDSSIDVSNIYVGFSYEEPLSSREIGYAYHWCMSRGSIQSSLTNDVNTGTKTELQGKLCKYLVVYPRTDDTYNCLISAYDIQLELGSTATTYEPYDPNRTVYGGYVDVARGEVVNQYTYIPIPTNDVRGKMLGSNYNGASNTHRYFHSYVIEATSALDVVCDKLQTTNNVTINTPLCINVEYRSGNIHYCLPNDLIGVTSETTDDERDELIKEYLTNNPIYVSFKTNSSTAYPITPTSLATLLNQNTFYSNTNSTTEISYAIHDSAPIRAAKARITANEPHIETVTGNLANFSTDMKAPLKSCKVYFNPVQDGTGDPSPDNIKPITGWTGTSTHKTGKSIVSFLQETRTQASAYYNGNSGWCNQNTDFNNLLGLTLTYSVYIDATNATGTGNNNTRIWGKYKNGSWAFLASGGNNIASGSKGLSVKTITIPDNLDWIVFGLGLEIGATASNPMVEFGSTATEYEPYIGTTIPLDWSSTAGTLYGGYVDLVSGELWKTHKEITFNGSEAWGIYENTNYGNSFYITINDKKISESSSLCDRYKNKNRSYGVAGSGQYGIFCDHETIKRLYFKAPDSSITTLQQFKTWLSTNNLFVVYELATPIEYSLAPSTLKTLRGQNNIWSNANGNIEVQFYSH